MSDILSPRNPNKSAEYRARRAELLHAYAVSRGRALGTSMTA